MKEGLFRVLSNRPLTCEVFEMKLSGDVSAFRGPGQFCEVALPGLFLRRPISLADLGRDEATLIYKTVGKGTRLMKALPAGSELSLLTGLGNGYDLSRAGKAPLLLGGGVGVPPLYLLAKKLLEENRRVRVILGFNKKSEIFYENEFRSLGAEVTVTTADGSEGIKGFVTDALPEGISYFYACGPLPMLKAVYRAVPSDGEFSLEERMGCGFGACMGCSVETRSGAKRVCREGPVFRKEELLWEK